MCATKQSESLVYRAVAVLPVVGPDKVVLVPTARSPEHLWAPAWGLPRAFGVEGEPLFEVALRAAGDALGVQASDQHLMALGEVLLDPCQPERSVSLFSLELTPAAYAQLVVRGFSVRIMPGAELAEELALGRLTDGQLLCALTLWAAKMARHGTGPSRD